MSAELHTDIEMNEMKEGLRIPVDWLTLAFWGTVALSFIMRFYDLASMPLHHDESLYGVYCWRFFTGQGYRYDPMMHGPFMFHFQLLIFFLFGVGDFAVRIAPAFLGVLLIASTWFLREWIGKLGILLVALLVTFSPTHLYFSRFMRHDSYVAFFTYVAVIFGLLYYRHRRKRDLYLAAAALSLMFCVKENAYIHAFIFMSFAFIKDVLATLMRTSEAVFRRKMLFGWVAITVVVVLCIAPIFLFGKAPFSGWIEPLLGEASDGNLLWIARMLITIATIAVGIWVVVYFWQENTFLEKTLVGRRSYHYSLIFAAFLFFWIYLLLYSSFFTNKAGLWDGFSRSWVYWWNQHSIQRIKGPFHYYVPFFVLYELPLVSIALGGVLYKISSTLNRAILAGWATVFSGILIYFYGEHPLPSWLKATHMENRFDLILTCYVLCIGLWATIDFLRKKEHFSAFFTYWSAMGFLIYSYAGEKVPWLLLHIMLPIFVLDGVFLREFFQSKIWRRHTVRMEYLLGILLTFGAGAALVYAYYANPLLSFLGYCLLACVMTGLCLWWWRPWRRQEVGAKCLKASAVIIGALCILYILHTTILLNYYNRANPVERMVYTQTSTDVLKLMELVEDIQFGIGSEEAKKPLIAVQGNAVWPLHWYLRDYESWYYPGDLAGMQRPLAVIDWEQREEFREVFQDDYQEIRVKLREWWIPGENGSLKDWWKYFLYREVYSPTGSSDVLLYVRKTL